MDCNIRIAKTKALISFAVTVKLICVFVLAYAKIRFSHDAAHMIIKGIYSDMFIGTPTASPLTSLTTGF